MSVTESIWAMVNLTLSALAVIWLTASYAKVAFQKTNKRANLLLLGYAAFLTICFFAVSYGMYGDVKYLILEKTRSLYSLLFGRQSSSTTSLHIESSPCSSGYFTASSAALQWLFPILSASFFSLPSILSPRPIFVL